MMIKTKLITLLLTAALAGGIMSCNKQDYYSDSGKQSGLFEENIYEFISERPFLYDSLVRIVDLAGMKTILESEEVTFFAPPDRSVKLLMNFVNGDRYRAGKDSLHIEEIPGDIWRKYLSRYIFEGRYMLNDISRIDFSRVGLFPGQNIESYDGFIMNMGVTYGAYSGTQDVGPRTIMLTSVGSDITKITGADAETVSTSNLQPKNGVIHALKGIIQFSFNSDFASVVRDNVP